MATRKPKPLTTLAALRATRRFWTRNPITRVKPNRKGYSRAQSKREARREA